MQTTTEVGMSPTNSEEALNILLGKLESILSNPEQKDVWTEKDIMQYLQLGQSTISRKVVAHPKFPTPLVGSDFGKKRWFRTDVIKFLDRHRGTM